MAITFVGFISLVGQTDADVRGLRETGGLPQELTAKVRDLPSKLPPTCKLVGSRTFTGGETLGVMVVEAESFDDLQFINSYYNGWLQFDWHPTRTGGVQRD